MPIPVRIISDPGSATLGQLAGAPNWASLGYGRVNQVNGQQNDLMSRDAAGLKELSRQLTIDRGNPEGQSSPGFYEMEPSDDPAVAFPGLRYPADPAVLAQFIALAAVKNQTVGSLGPFSGPQSFYGPPFDANVGSQMLAAGAFAYYDAAIVSLQLGSISLLSESLATWMQVNGVDNVEPSIAAYGLSGKPRWYLVQFRYNDFGTLVGGGYMPEDVWKAQLGWVATHANAARGDQLLILTYGGTYSAGLHGPYFNDVAEIVGGVQPVSSAPIIAPPPPTPTTAAVSDPVSQVYGRLAAILKGEPSLFDPDGKSPMLIRPGNFITYDGDNPNPDKTWQESIPVLQLDTDRGSDSQYSRTVTFATMRGAQSSWQEQIVQNYVVTLTAPDTRIKTMTALRNGVLMALRKAGPRMGMPQIVLSTGQPTWQPVAQLRQNKKSPQRQERITIPVTFTFEGSQLLSA